MQAVATEFGMDDIRTKRQREKFSLFRPIFNDRAKMKRAAPKGGPLSRINKRLLLCWRA
jgi:hypothetical protein